MTSAPRCKQCGADSNGAELCPRCDLRRREETEEQASALAQQDYQRNVLDRAASTRKPYTGLAPALVQAQQAAQAVAKSSTNTYDRYRYASAESMIAEGREALNSAGLSLSVRSSRTNGNELLTTFLLEHVSGESREVYYDCPIVENPKRPAARDKAVATARTYTLGYALRDLLLLPRVEEGTDTDQRDDRHHEPPAKPVATSTKEDTEAGAVLEQLIGEAKSTKALNMIAAEIAKKIPEQSPVRAYLREKYAQRASELSDKPGPAKAGPS